jgi:probable rRNA maturation factor
MRVTVVRSPDLDASTAALIRRAGLSVLLRHSGDTLDVGDRSLVVRLTDDQELRQLNARFLDTDSPTDVLAFPAGEPGHVGDVAISVERAADQAVRAGGRAEDELRLLAVHGLLHCLGYDHGGPQAAAVMTAATRRLLPGHAVPDLAG